MTAAVPESWKYTDIRSLEAMAWGVPERLSSRSSLSLSSLPHCGRVVFHNGYFRENESFLPAGMHFTPFMHSRPPLSDPRIAALNAAHRQDRVGVSVEAGARFDRPLEILCVADAPAPQRSAPQLEISCGPGALLAIVERQTGTGTSLGVPCFFLNISAGAHLRHIRVQQAAEDAYLLASLEIDIEKSGRYSGFLYSVGGALSRLQVAASLAGPGADLRIDALNLARGKKTLDLTTSIRHEGPGARSFQQVHSVLEGPVRGVYQGCIHVAPGADGTDARQQSRALLLSEGAEMDTKPELEILADDVKCTHGAATGSLDAEALFYLRSRGLPEKEARGLLVRGFVSEILEQLPEPDLRNDIEAHIAQWMGGCVR